MTAVARLALARTKPAKEPNAAVRREGDDLCPVAQLATEAASILRAMKALGHSELRDPDTEGLEESAFALYQEFESDSEGPTALFVSRSLFKRLYAVKAAAKFRRANSLKGALFQLYLSGNIAANVSGALIDTKEHSRDLDAIREAEETCDRLLHSAIAALQPLVADDDDLTIVRRWFFDPRFDPIRITDLAIEKAATTQR